MTSDDLLEPLRRRRSCIEKLAEQVRTLEATRQGLHHAIADYHAFQPDLEMGKIEKFETTAPNLSRKIADQEVNKTNLEHRLRAIKAGRASPLVVWKFFTADQKQLRAEAGRLERELSSTKRCLSDDKESLSELHVDASTARKRLSDHDSFNLGNANERLSSIGREIERIETDQASASAELARIETKIRPHTQELDRLKSELATLKSDIMRANRLEQELSSASNSYERAMIHKECEEEFSTGRQIKLSMVAEARHELSRTIFQNLSGELGTNCEN